jgi:hypothetical protein
VVEVRESRIDGGGGEGSDGRAGKLRKRKKVKEGSDRRKGR